MLITDHINLSGVNVLTGPNEEELGERFTSLRDAYDPELRDGCGAAAASSASSSPRASTSPLAARASRPLPRSSAFRTLGADAVGMSTVHETIVARHCGLRVAAVSAITNLAEGMATSRSATSRPCATPHARRPTWHRWSPVSSSGSDR